MLKGRKILIGMCFAKCGKVNINQDKPNGNLSYLDSYVHYQVTPTSIPSNSVFHLFNTFMTLYHIWALNIGICEEDMCVKNRRFNGVESQRYRNRVRWRLFQLLREGKALVAVSAMHNEQKGQMWLELKRSTNKLMSILFYGLKPEKTSLQVE